MKAISGMESVRGPWFRFYSEQAAIFCGKFPTHAFFEDYLIHAWLHSLKFKDALTVLDGIITCDAEEFIAEKGKPFRIIRYDPLLTPGPIFPELQDKWLINQNLAVIAGINGGDLLGTSRVHTNMFFGTTDAPPNFLISSGVDPP